MRRLAALRVDRPGAAARLRWIICLGAVWTVLLLVQACGAIVFARRRGSVSATIREWVNDYEACLVRFHRRCPCGCRSQVCGLLLN